MGAGWFTILHADDSFRFWATPTKDDNPYLARFLGGKVGDGTVSRTADRWFLSVTVEIPDPPVVRRENQAVVGVDLGVSALATLSTGEKITGPKAYTVALKKIRRLSKRFCRQMEAATVRAGLEPGQPIPQGMHIIRAGALQPLTTYLVNRFDVLAIEDLNVAGMLKNHKLARAIADMGFGEFRRQVEYKAAQHGKTVVAMGRWYPSSKTCSTCGHKATGCCPISPSNEGHKCIG